MKWFYGVTTVPKRRDDGTLARTLESLRGAGFDRPRLFVDGAAGGFEEFGLDVTYRWPLVRVFGNWVLSLWELYARQPDADRYAIFQDDALFCRNLRPYLEGCQLLGQPDQRAYLNLYTVAGNVGLSRKHGKDGWFKANQMGKGALGLVFDNRGVRELLASKLIVDRLWDSPQFGWRSLDGAVVEALCRSELKERGTPYTEYCHRPSLCQHTGRASVMDKRKWVDPTAKDTERGPVTTHDPNHPVYTWGEETDAPDFQGEGWDVMAAMG